MMICVQKAPLAGIRVRSSIICESGCSAIYRIVFETLVEESIDVLSKSDLIDFESQRGVLTEPKVIVQALIEFDLSSSLRHLVTLLLMVLNNNHIIHHVFICIDNANATI